MAVEYLQDPDANGNKLLNAFNNNILVFTDDGNLDVKSCTISISEPSQSGFPTFRLSPINNQFEFNLYEVSKITAKYYKFRDTIQDYNLGLKRDDFVTFYMDLEIEITLEDGSKTDDTKGFTFLKSVSQIYPVKDYEQGFNLFSKSNLTFFKGYPFDVSLVGNTSEPLTVKNNVKGNEIEYTSIEERLVYSRGDYMIDSSPYAKGNVVLRVEEMTDYNLDNIDCGSFPNGNPILDVGYNDVSLTKEGKEIKCLIRLRDICEGVYIRWIDDNGCWSYWLFSSKYTENKSVRTLDSYRVNEQDITTQYESELIMGKEGEKAYTVYDTNITSDEANQLKSLPDSPRIELYNGKYGDNVRELSKAWQTIALVDSSFMFYTTKRDIINLTMQFKKPLFTIM